MAAPDATSRTTYRDVFGLGEFRALWLAELLSVAGDQLARVALTVLVFNRTHSAALTGLTYALTFVPTVVGALTLSSVADRRPRRSVLISIDALCALVVAGMAIPGTPLVVLCVLVAVMAFLGGPYKAAQLALLRDVLAAERYPVGTAIRQITTQAAQLGGFAVGGILCAVTGPQACLGIDAATFAVSALLLGRFVAPRPAPKSTHDSRSSVTGVGLVWPDPRRRAIFLTTVLGLFYIAPDGVAAPYVAEHGHGAVMLGLVLASGGVGAVIGVPLFSRFVPAERRWVALPVACLVTGLPLVLVLAPGGIYVAIALFAVTGAIWAVQVVMAVSFLAELLPNNDRARGMGVAGAMNTTAQGLGTALAGLVGQATSPTLAIALAGAASVVAAAWPSALWLRSARARSWATEPAESDLSGEATSTAGHVTSRPPATESSLPT